MIKAQKQKMTKKKSAIYSEIEGKKTHTFFSI